MAWWNSGNDIHDCPECGETVEGAHPRKLCPECRDDKYIENMSESKWRERHRWIFCEDCNKIKIKKLISK